jgi:cell division protein FtsB
MGHNATDTQELRRSRVVVYGIIAFELILITSLIRGLNLSQKSRERVDLLRETRSELEEEHARLLEQSKYVQSDYYIEQVAREELQLFREGETVIILPDEQLVKTGLMQIEKREEVHLPNWQKWLRLLVQ